MALTTLAAVYFIVEGPNYLYRKKMLDRCKESIRFIAKINGKEK